MFNQIDERIITLQGARDNTTDLIEQLDQSLNRWSGLLSG